jgi:membrane protein
VIERVDAFQRRHRWAGLPLAVVYKFVDDQGSYLTALITYYGFVSLFPLLLLLVTVLGFALQDSPGLQQQVLDSALAQFPVIGDQIGTNIHSFHGSVLGLITGVLGSLYAGLGVVQAAQNALNKMWGVPRNSRPNPITARLRSLLLLAAGGAIILTTTVLSALTATTGSYGSGVRVGATIIAIALNIALFTTAFHVLTARSLTTAQVRAGAVAAAVSWQVLQVGRHVPARLHAQRRHRHLRPVRDRARPARLDLPRRPHLRDLFCAENLEKTRITRDPWHGEWNYQIHPTTTNQDHPAG